MNLHRLRAKYFLQDGADPDLDALIPVFHRWIQEQVLDELMIDVADYKHVHHGPGILLIGHAADYALDLDQGRPGLVYHRKRDVPPILEEALRLVVERAVLGAHLLGTEDTLEGRFAFDPGTLEISFTDRLRAPNRHQTLDHLLEKVTAVLTDLYGTSSLEVAWVDDDVRMPLTLRATIPAAPDFATLVAGRQNTPA